MIKHLTLIIFLIFNLTVASQNQIGVTKSNLNLRTSPKIENNVLTTIPISNLVSIINASQVNGNWVKVKYNGLSGYVNKGYLTVSDNPFVTHTKPSSNNNPTTFVRYYTNSRGEKVQSPTHYNSRPAGATAICRDGTYSFSRSRRGTCSRHGGVKTWL